MRRALDDDMDGWFEVEERTDYAQQALDEWRKEQRDPAPGVYPVVIDTRGRDRRPGRRDQSV